MGQMESPGMRPLRVFVSFVVLSFFFPAKASPRVIVNDLVVQKGQRVMLRAETKGTLFSKGGELVEFFIDGKSHGKTLSGGDGLAFKPFTPQRTGLHEIQVKSGGEEDSALLLSLKRGVGIVFVDVQGALLEGRFSRKPKHESQNVIQEISDLHPVVFLQRGFVSLRMTEEWLKDHEFLNLPVVPWRKGKVFDEMADMGLRVEAIIGAGAVIESARKYGPRSFSFEPVDDETWVRDWEEIKEKLLKEGR
jgi:hypothetical protein